MSHVQRLRIGDAGGLRHGNIAAASFCGRSPLQETRFTAPPFPPPLERHAKSSHARPTPRVILIRFAA